MNTKEFAIRRMFCSEVQFTTAPAAGQNVKFRENPIFSNKDFADKVRIQGIFVYYDGVMAFSPSGQPNIAFADVANLALTLLDMQSREIIDSMPLNQFNTFVNGGFFYPLEDLAINYSNSYVRVLDVGTIAAGQSVSIAFAYKLVK